MSKKAQEGPLEQNQAADKVLDDTSRKTRRGLIKAGLIGIPVVITLKSSPAWGQDASAQTPSVMASLTHHSHTQN
jgi:hypothetical protein